MKTKVAIYLRVSKGEKDKNGKPLMTTDNQRGPLLHYCGMRGMEVVEIYEDKISAVKDRPAFEQLMEDARIGKFNTIVAWKLDRVCRSVKHFVLWCDELKRINCRIVLMMDNIDTLGETPASRAMAGMMAVFAQLERETIQVRTIAGIARAREEGKLIGGAAKANRKLVDKDRLRRLANEGMSVRAIAQELQVPKSIIGRLMAEIGIRRKQDKDLMRLEL